MSEQTQAINPTTNFNQACLDIINQWRSGELGESTSANQLTALIREAQSENHKANQARGYNALSFLYNNSGKYDKAIAYAKIAKNLFGQIGNVERMAGIYISLGEIYRLQANYRQASQMYEKALELSNNPEVDRVHNMFARGNYGHVALAAKEYEKARDLLEKTLDEFSPYLTPDHINTWLIPPRAVQCEYQSALAEAYVNLGEYDKSWNAVQESYRIACELERKIEKAIIYRTVGQLIMKQPSYTYTDFSEHYTYYLDEAYKLFEQNGAEGDAALTNLIHGRLLTENNEFQQAKRYFEKAATQFTRLGMFALARQANNEAR